MAKLVQSLLISLVLIESCSYLALAQQPKPFDYFLLAQQWPPAHCNTNRTRCQYQPLPRDFTIHGLWPQNFTGPNLRNCSIASPYVPITNGALYNALIRQWPELQNNNSNRFWKHEWDMHGTCSLILYNQSAYFNLTLQLKNRYDIFSHLNASHIVPSNITTYPVNTITQAIKNLTKTDVRLQCNINSNNRVQLHEVRICFTPLGAVMNCTGSSTSCGTGNITFPDFLGSTFRKLVTFGRTNFP